MLAAIDWLIVTAYLVFATLIGIFMMKKAGQGLLSYFGAGRSLPWWWLGTSMVATTFAADTPLAITGIVAGQGIAGNWFWWSWILSYTTIAVFFAKKWRNSEVLTDVELIELRYEGKEAAFLRGFKAFYLSIAVNGIILGWVFRAMSKITGPFIHWDSILSPGLYQSLESTWPEFFLFHNFNDTLTISCIFLLVVFYSYLGGIRGVILTDLIQFTMGIAGAIIFAFLAVDYVGGLSSLYEQIETIYPEQSEELLSFWPTFDGAFPLRMFLIFMVIQWWAQYYSDGSGYLAQRINTARTALDAEKGAFWFTIANFSLRTWPWVMVGLVALVVFPLQIEDQSRFEPIAEDKLLYETTPYQSDSVNNDREMAYPVLMQLVLPAGLLGLVFASLLAAFMSTVDTHLNWGGSYLVNDVYKRFLRPQATNRELVFASRTSIILMAIMAVFIAGQIGSIEGAWKFLMALASGMGLPQILRWLWWRTNAWTEISGMTTALFLTVLLSYMQPDMSMEYLLFWTATTSALISIIVTLITPPVRREKLDAFRSAVQPYGFWPHAGKDFLYRIIIWILANISVFSAMFSIGYFLKLMPGAGIISLSIFIISSLPVIYLLRNEAKLIGSKS